MILRLRFSKKGPVRFISHRDVARAWERGFRRAALPLQFTQGFSPHPKVSFGLALPLGYESEAEYLDVTLEQSLDPALVRGQLNAVSPAGIVVEEAREIDPHTPSSASESEWGEYLVAVVGPDDGPPPAAATLQQALAALWSQPQWMVPRRRKGEEVGGSEDMKPLVASIDVISPAPSGFEPLALRMRLATRPRVVRPEEVCALFEWGARLSTAGEAASPDRVGPASSAPPPTPPSSVVPDAACVPRLVRRTAQLFTQKEVSPVHTPLPSSP